MRTISFAATLAAATVLAACGGDSTAPPPTGNPTLPAQLHAIGGNQQVGIVGRALADSLVVHALTASGAPAAGATVNWSASGGSVSSSSTITDAGGFARVQWTAGSGAASMSATIAGVAPVSFSSTGRANGACILTPSSTTQRFSLGPTDFTLSLRATGALRIAVLFADFPDVAGVENPAGLMTDIVDPGIRLMRELSYNRMNITTVAFPKWYRMSRPIGSYVWRTYAGHREYIMEVMRLADPEVDFSSFDAVYIFAPASTAQVTSPTFNGGTTSGVVFDGRNFGNAVTFGNDSRTYGPAVVAHETGHMLGLVDLYAFDPAGGANYAGNQFKFAGAWSLMSNVFNPAHYLMWEKRKLGFLDDNQVDCLDGPGGEEAIIQPNASVGGLKMIGIPLAANRALVVEVRSNQALDANLCASGVLIYEVDASTPSGNGPVLIRGSRATTSGAAFSKCGPWADAVYGVGAGAVSTFSDPSGVTVTVLSTETGGAYRVRVKR